MKKRKHVLTKAAQERVDAHVRQAKALQAEFKKNPGVLDLMEIYQSIQDMQGIVGNGWQSGSGSRLVANSNPTV